MSQERYLKPEVIRTIKRLDLRAQFIVRGFMHGLHSSPLAGFSVEFSEHRKYTHGDDPNDIDWLAYAKTEKYYVKKYEAETNLTGYLAVDTSRSMNYTFRQEMTKFDYAVSLAAALAYLMIQQRDPVGLVTFDEKLRSSIKPKTRRTQLATILSHLSHLSHLTPSGSTNLAASLNQLAAMLKRQSLVMLLSDLLVDSDSVLQALYRLKHSGHDVILFHILDEAEVTFPFGGRVELEEPETAEKIRGDAHALRGDYLDALNAFRDKLANECHKSRIDYVPLDTSIQFDRALVEYLTRRAQR